MIIIRLLLLMVLGSITHEVKVNLKNRDVGRFVSCLQRSLLPCILIQRIKNETCNTLKCFSIMPSRMTVKG